MNKGKLLGQASILLWVQNSGISRMPSCSWAMGCSAVDCSASTVGTGSASSGPSSKARVAMHILAVFLQLTQT